MKGIEVYKGKVIIHSLANFVMESEIAKKEGLIRSMKLKSWAEMNAKLYRPRHPDQSKSLIVKCAIAGKKIQRVSYIPVQLDLEWANPEPLKRTDPRAQEIFQYQADITKDACLNTEFAWDGDEVLISAPSLRTRLPSTAAAL